MVGATARQSRAKPPALKSEYPHTRTDQRRAWTPGLSSNPCWHDQSASEPVDDRQCLAKFGWQFCTAQNAR